MRTNTWPQSQQKRLDDIKASGKKGSSMSTLKLSIAISDHDLQVKANQLKRLLEKSKCAVLACLLCCPRNRLP